MAPPMRILPIAALFLLISTPVAAQAAPCATPEARQLDFWLGEWNLTWEGGRGTNSITRRFGNCVIQENFSGELDSGPFRGHSVSVYDERSEQWRQTWVDDRGGYLLFAGGFDEDGIMRLYGEQAVLEDGRRRITRMSWLNVERDSLDWHWERSFDGGETWDLVWAIHYERAVVGSDVDG